MSKNVLKEKTKEELIAEFASETQRLYYEDDNVETSNDEQKDEYEKEVLNDFQKFTRLIKKFKKLSQDLETLEKEHKDNVELQRYIKFLKALQDTEKAIDEARKGYLYESAILSPDTKLENSVVKATLTKPHDRIEFEKEKFIEDYGKAVYDKYTTRKSVKGNIKYKILG